MTKDEFDYYCNMRKTSDGLDPETKDRVKQFAAMDKHIEEQCERHSQLMYSHSYHELNACCRAEVLLSVLQETLWKTYKDYIS